MAPNARLTPARSWRHAATLGGPATIALAVALFVGIFVLREGDPHVVDADEILFVVPIALLTLRFGFRGGLAGGLLGFALIVAWDLYDPAQLTMRGYLGRGIAFLMLGTLLGTFVDRRREAEGLLAARTCELEVARTETLQRLALAGECRDQDTSKHTERVGVTAAELGAGLGLGADQIDLLREAAPLHDVGKLAISDAILLKPGKLTEPEYEVMKTHTWLGAHLLSGSSSPVLQMAEVIAESHHERWDGDGYPKGLDGEAIPLVGRIVAVADVFDALTHTRPYKSAWPVEHALVEMQLSSGSQFEPRIVDALLTMHDGAAVAADTPSPQQRPRIGARRDGPSSTAQLAPQPAHHV